MWRPEERCRNYQGADGCRQADEPGAVGVCEVVVAEPRDSSECIKECATLPGESSTPCRWRAV